MCHLEGCRPEGSADGIVEACRVTTCQCVPVHPGVQGCPPAVVFHRWLDHAFHQLQKSLRRTARKREYGYSCLAKDTQMGGSYRLLIMIILVFSVQVNIFFRHDASLEKAMTE